MFKAPKLTFEPKRQAEVPFIGTVGANTHLTLISSKIPFAFRVKLAKMVFTPDANNLVRHYWLISFNESVSTTGVPADTNLFSREAPTAYFIGDSIIRRVFCNIRVTDVDMIIKLHTDNQLAAAYVINCSLTIEEL